jgi:hypothetical protein
MEFLASSSPLDSRARVFNEDGAPPATEFPAHTTTKDKQRVASLTSLTDGRDVVVWDDDNLILAPCPR